MRRSLGGQNGADAPIGDGPGLMTPREAVSLIPMFPSSEWTEEAIQRITTENTTLKQRVRTLTAGNRTLEEKLKAARENLRFHDKRIADLEAQLAPPQ